MSQSSRFLVARIWRASSMSYTNTLPKLCSGSFSLSTHRHSAPSSRSSGLRTSSPSCLMNHLLTLSWHMGTCGGTIPVTVPSTLSRVLRGPGRRSSSSRRRSVSRSHATTRATLARAHSASARATAHRAARDRSSARTTARVALRPIIVSLAAQQPPQELALLPRGCPAAPSRAAAPAPAAPAPRWQPWQLSAPRAASPRRRRRAQQQWGAALGSTASTASLGRQHLALRLSLLAASAAALAAALAASAAHAAYAAAGPPSESRRQQQPSRQAEPRQQQQHCRALPSNTSNRRVATVTDSGTGDRQR